MLWIFNEYNKSKHLLIFEPLLQAEKVPIGGLLRLLAHSLLVLSGGAVNLSSFNAYLTERRRCIIATGFFALWNLSFQWPFELTFHTKCDLNIKLVIHLHHLKKSLRNANLHWGWLIETFNVATIVSCPRVGQGGWLHTSVLKLIVGRLVHA